MGEIRGTAYHVRGGPIPGVEVFFSRAKAVTDSGGNYRMRDVPNTTTNIIFRKEGFELFSKRITTDLTTHQIMVVNATLTPIAPPVEFPKQITRGAYSFTARNENEETQLNDFLGIDPPGDDLNTYLSKRDLAGLQEWKDYWFSIFGPMDRPDLLTFTDNKFEEYRAKIEVPPEVPPEIKLIDIIKKIFGLERPPWPDFPSDKLKPEARPIWEKMKSAYETKNSALMLEALREAAITPYGSVTLAAILAAMGVISLIVTIIGTYPFAKFLDEEAIQTLDFNINRAIDAGDYEIAKELIDAKQDTINEMLTEGSDFNRVVAATINQGILAPLGFPILFPSPATIMLTEIVEILKASPIGSKIPFLNVIIAAETYARNAQLSIKSQLARLEDLKEEVEEEEIKLKQVVTITPIPSDAKVSVSGQIPTTGTFSSVLDVGTYDYTVSKFNFISKSGTFTVEEGEPVSFTVELEKEVEEEIPPEEVLGKLTINVSPEDAFIEIAGKPEITMPGTYDLSPGSYSVKASKPDFISQTKTAYVSEKKDTVVSFILEEVEIPPELPTKATIEIISEPTNSDIYIDGEYTFTKTPYTTVLDPGTYIIRVQRDEYFPQEASVSVSEGDEIIVPFVLEEIPEPEKPVVEYLPQEPWFPEYVPPTYYTPAVETTPYSQVSLLSYPLLSPPSFKIAPKPSVPTTIEKEILINIETTDLKPWKGRIFSIAWLDLSMPEAEPQVIVDEDEQGILEEFINMFEREAFTKISGFKIIFDYRYIFNKLMLYRMQSKAFFYAELKDIKQLMDQIKEAFVYFPDKTGTLNDYGKELLGIGKYGTQETLLRRYIAGDIDYVERFQLQQIQVTQGLYDLFRFSSSGGSVTQISTAPVPPSPYSIVKEPLTPQSTQTKKCPNCLSEEPAGAEFCSICKTKL